MDNDVGNKMPARLAVGRKAGQNRTVKSVKAEQVKPQLVRVVADDSWGARTHPEYLLPAKAYSYRFRLKPYSKDMGGANLARQTLSR